MSDMSASAGADAPQAAVVIERTYRAQVEALWALWTTKAGFEFVVGPRGLSGGGSQFGGA